MNITDYQITITDFKLKVMKTVIIIALALSLLQGIGDFARDEDNSIEKAIAHLIYFLYMALALVFACIIKIH